MFDNITPAERQNSRRTDPAYLKANKAKFFYQQAQSEAEDSNGSHAEITPLRVYFSPNTNSTGEDKFNSLWVVPITILVFVAVIFLTNSCLGL